MSFIRQSFTDPAWPASWIESFNYEAEESAEARITPYGELYRLRQKLILKLTETFVTARSSILDVAAAHGSFSIKLAQKGYDVTWNDIRAELAGYVKRKSDAEKLNYLPGNVADIEGNESYDAVLALEVIEHVAEPDKFLSHLLTFLKPGGILILSTPNGQYFRERGLRLSLATRVDRAELKKHQYKPNADGHIFLLWPDEVRQMTRQFNAHLEELTLFGSPLTAGHCKLRYLYSILPLSWFHFLEGLSRHLPRSCQQFVMTSMIAVIRKESTERD